MLRNAGHGCSHEMPVRQFRTARPWRIPNDQVVLSQMNPKRVKRSRCRRPQDTMQTLDAAYVEHVSQALELLRKKWTIQILCAMRERPVRLSELQRLFPLASKKALTASLRSMEGAKIVVRRDLSHSVLHVEYELSLTMRRPLVQLTDCLARCGASYEARGSFPVSLEETNRE